MKIRLLYLFLLILAMSCSKEPKFKVQEITSFPINKELTGEVVQMDNMPACPSYLLVVGKYMVLLNYDDCDIDHFHVFDKKSFRLIGSFGSFGRGPNELYYPIPTKQIVDNDTLNGFWIKNQKNKRYEFVNIEKSLKRKQCVVEDNAYKTPGSEGQAFDCYHVSGKKIIACSSSGEKGRFFTHNFMDQSTQWLGFVPKISTINYVHKGMDQSILYSAENAFSIDGGHFVSALKIAKRIDIFSNTLEHQVSIMYDDSPKNIKLVLEKEDDWHNTFVHLDGLYIGEDLMYVFNQKISLSGQLTDNIPEIHVLSLEGKAVARYRLDVNIRFEDFTIDEESQSAYFLFNDDEGYPQISRYNMQE